MGTSRETGGATPPPGRGVWVPEISDADRAILDCIDEAEEATAAPDDGELATLLPSDLGLAERLDARHGRDMLFVEELGWLVWSGGRWTCDPGAALRRAQDTARKVQAEFAEVVKAGKQDGEGDAAFARRMKVLRSFQVTAGAFGKSQAMLGHLAAWRRARMDELDRFHWRLNVTNGTLHLDSPGSPRLHVPRRSDRATRQCSVPFSADAQAPRFRAFIGEILPEPDVAEFVQRWLGYCLCGDISEQKMVVFEGKGANGKSTLLEVVARVLGDYAVTVPIDTWLYQDRRSGSGPSPDLARLPGARLVRTSEPEPGARFGESLIKQFTGGEPITARKLMRDFFDFTPTGKLTLSVNIKPVLVGKDHGIRRRMLVVPFTQTFAGGRARRARPLSDELLEEGPGILNWLLEGYVAWRETGLPVPSEVQAATEAYFTEMDPIGSFAREACAQGPECEEESRLLWAGWRKWCEANGEDQKSTTAFGRRLSDLGFGKRHSNGKLYRKGLMLRSEWRDAGLYE